MKLSALTSELDLTRRQINYAINQFNEDLEMKKISQRSSVVTPVILQYRLK